MLMASKRAILAVTLAVVVVAAAGAVIWQHEHSKVQAEPAKVIDWQFSALHELQGQYLDDEGNAVIDAATWQGDIHDLITLWNAAKGPSTAVEIFKIIVTFKAQPGETIYAEEFQLRVPESIGSYADWGHVNCLISHDGKTLHNSLCSTSATADEHGHAELTVIILGDGLHVEPWFRGAPAPRLI